jgi:hypothetical protein
MMAAPVMAQRGYWEFEGERPPYDDPRAEDENRDRFEDRNLVEERRWRAYERNRRAREEQERAAGRYPETYPSEPRWEESASFTTPDKYSVKEIERRALEARFINPRPDLGCMYYDVYNNRRWWPNCREL